jgi:type VI secretion system protein ImpJ
MRNPQVHWYEGLFLHPQHFQAQDRFWDELLRTGHQWDHPYHYGLCAFEYSPEALANHRLEVRTLKARMRDGTLVALDGPSEPDAVDLKEAVGGGQPVSANLAEAFEHELVARVYLGVPKLKLGRPNVGLPESQPRPRYVELRQPTADESQGGAEQELEFRTLNARLLLSTDDLSGYEVLPIAQIKRAGAGEARPEIDREYIPPVLAVDAWPRLGRDIVRAVYDVAGQKTEVLAQQVVDRGIGFSSRDPGDMDRILMLSQLNAAHAALGVLAFAKGVHPLVAYTELCRLLGQLSIFHRERRAIEVPPYDHEDLARIFFHVQQQIEAIINSVRDYEYEQRYFMGVGMGMQVTLEPKWFNSDWSWYIGVNKGELTQQECRELLSSGQLDWKLGSSRQVEILFTQRAEGLQMTMLDRPVRALPARPEWMYYEVSRRDAPAWRDVQSTQTLAMRLRDSLIMNQDRLQGERQLVVKVGGRNVPLQFALFAVPNG